jgi:hypothetical protein
MLHFRPRQARYERNIGALSCKHCCSVGKKYACSLGHPACKAYAPYCIAICDLLAVYFSTLSHKRHDFGEKMTDQKLRVMIFSTVLSDTFLMIRRIHGVC